VEPVRLRRRMGSAHGRLARADGGDDRIPGREDRRGLASPASGPPSWTVTKIGPPGDGSPIGRRTAFANARCSCSTARELFLELLLADGETRQSAVADFARELLAVADNLQRALAAIGEEARRGEGRGSKTSKPPAHAGIRAFPRAPDRGAGQAFRSDAARSGGGGRERGNARNRRQRRRGWIHDPRPPAAAGQRRAKARPNAASPSIAPEPQGGRRLPSGGRDDRLSAHPQNAA
jgi:hypothetical protein